MSNETPSYAVYTSDNGQRPLPATRIDTADYRQYPAHYRSRYGDDPSLLKSGDKASGGSGGGQGGACSPRCLSITGVILIVLALITLIIAIFVATGDIDMRGGDRRTTTLPNNRSTTNFPVTVVGGDTTTTLAPTSTTPFVVDPNATLIAGAVPLRGQMALTNWQHLPELNDPESPLYQAYQGIICGKLIATLVADGVETPFCAIVAMSPGSIISSYSLQVVPKANEDPKMTADRVQADITAVQETEPAFAGYTTPLSVDFCILTPPADNPCDQVCLTDPEDTTTTQLCACFPGYALQDDMVTCQDVDECEAATDDCSHNCTNTVGGFTCYCPSEYVLHSDEKTCYYVDVMIGPESSTFVSVEQRLMSSCTVEADSAVLGDLMTTWSDPAGGQIGDDSSERVYTSLGSMGGYPVRRLTVTMAMPEDSGPFRCTATYRGTQMVSSDFDVFVSQCEPDQFPCRVDDTCLSRDQHCDDVVHCRDMSDENQCDCARPKRDLMASPTDNQFMPMSPPSLARCDDGLCLDVNKWCDSVVDCADSSDEQPGCSRGCPNDYFRCGDGGDLMTPPLCIHPSLVCDLEAHCPKAEDEATCECPPAQEVIDAYMERMRRDDGCGSGMEPPMPETTTFRPPTSTSTFRPPTSTSTFRPPSTDTTGTSRPTPDPRPTLAGTTDPWRTCASGQCVPSDRFCDGTYDCLDHSDESSCPCPNPQDWRCGDGACVSHYRTCNGLHDCSDGSDEAGCACPPYRPHQCSSGSCIYASQYCNGYNDCGDWSDENNCRNCTAGEFRCASGLCRPGYAECDGRNDCEDLSDETNCACNASSMRCANYVCMLSGYFCDSLNDCGDGSDEENCECSDNEFQCTDPAVCIMADHFCDGVSDCADGSDEPENCVEMCLEGQISCDGRCVGQSYICDGRAHCLDFMDEKDCNCPLDHFRCANGLCRHEKSWCDGAQDCVTDQSDEPVGCDQACPLTYVRCENTQECAHPISVCSGFVDCTGAAADAIDCAQLGLSDSACGVSYYKGPAMMGPPPGGEESEDDAMTATPHEFPWQASVRNGSMGGGHICGGTVVGAMWVLTSASCVHGDTPARIQVVVGVHDVVNVPEGASWMAVDEIRTHPKFMAMSRMTRMTSQYDLALLRLTEPIVFTAKVQPICVTEEDFPTGHQCAVTSWPMGYYVRDTRLQVSMETVANRQLCEALLNPTMPDTTPTNGTTKGPSTPTPVPPMEGAVPFGDNMLCTRRPVDMNGNYTSPSQHSMGEPLMCAKDGVWQLYGLKMSSGPVNAYLRIPSYLGWINRQMGVCPDTWSACSPMTPDLCVMSNEICNGVNDCGDFSDEPSCRCTADQMACPGSGLCIDADAKCNKVNDCGDWSDEANCTCLPWERQCQNGPCLPVAEWCNGRFDCPELEDEANCTCLRDHYGSLQFRCDNGLCRPLREYCDETADCPDASDEKDNCHTTCPPGTEPCNATDISRGCLPTAARCDGYRYDCPNNEDEMDCPCSDREFSCADGRCLNSAYYWCNGYPECPEAEDEPPLCQTFCPPGFIKCNTSDGHCIALSSRCDGYRDCQDMEDETNCPCDEPGYFLCQTSGECLKDWAICDGYPQCRDESDELDCVCDDGAFLCDQSRCLSTDYRCNHYMDCRDGTDEHDCECSDSQFKCATMGNCTSLYSRCNGYNECGDWSDEMNCECRDDQFQCDIGPCLDEIYWCDGNPDCPDESDEPESCRTCSVNQCAPGQLLCQVAGENACVGGEKLCDEVRDCDGAEDEKPPICECLEASCSDGVCISAGRLCDLQADCPDASDEANCGLPCAPNQHLCDGRCISAALVCNGRINCQDLSDEVECVCNADKSALSLLDLRPFVAMPMEPLFRCGDGIGCQPLSAHCDGILDCQDGSDEENCIQNVGCPPEFFRCAQSDKCVPPESRCDMWPDCGDPRRPPADIDFSDELSCPCPPTIDFIGLMAAALPEYLAALANETSTTPPTATPNTTTPGTSNTVPPATPPATGTAATPATTIPTPAALGGMTFSAIFAMATNTSPPMPPPTPGPPPPPTDAALYHLPWWWVAFFSRVDPVDYMTVDFTAWGQHCSNGYCIHDSQVCDGQPICPDDSDEGCSTPPVCGTDMIPCNNTVSGRCLYPWQICNGYIECSDGEDESGCVCAAHESRCSAMGPCVRNSYFCDGYSHCPNGEDEQGCPCKGDQFTCDSGKCINASERCNFEHDCGDDDWSDELGCTCRMNQFLCGPDTDNQVCANEDQFCDRRSVDCPSSYDEQVTCDTLCREGQMSCDGKCIPASARCDGIRNCKDWSDEIGCTCGLNDFACGNGVCLSRKYWCDGDFNCPDFTDEPENCLSLCPPGTDRCLDNNECHSSVSKCRGLVTCMAYEGSVDCAAVQLPPASCGIPQLPGRSTFILGGDEVSPYTSPWQVRLYINSRFVCGGSLLSNGWVITAAHCLRDQNTMQLNMRLGMPPMYMGRMSEIQRGATMVTIHPEYDMTTMAHDLALIQLDIPVTFTPDIQPICLPNVNPVEGTLCKVTGYGATMGHGGRDSMSPTLQEIRVPFIDWPACTELWSQSRPGQPAVTASHVCAGTETAGACYGDDGGPLACPYNGVYKLVGVTGYANEGCETHGLASRMASVTAHLDWISTVTASEVVPVSP